MRIYCGEVYFDSTELIIGRLTVSLVRPAHISGEDGCIACVADPAVTEGCSRQECAFDQAPRGLYITLPSHNRRAAFLQCSARDLVVGCSSPIG